MKRRYWLLWCAASLLAGCTSWNLFTATKVAVDKTPPSGPPKFVGDHDLAVPYGLQPIKLEAVGLVAGLRGTGSDPEPSQQRAMLIDEMRRRGVKDPNQLLASRNYSLVLVRGYLRPGTQKGDRFDVELRIPGRSDTTSLRGGYLLETRLNDVAVVDDRLFNGKFRAVAEGPVLVDPSAKEKSDRVLLGRGRVLGGGVAHEAPSLGLFLPNAEELNMKPEQVRDAAVRSAQIANAINRRFHTFLKSRKTGVATAIRGNYVDLIVYPCYKDNIERYMQVLRAIALQESPTETSQRITGLEKELLEPSAAAAAAIKLEAIGTTAVDTLLKGSKSANAEVRFYAAEALAYLNRREAAEPLAEAARQEPAFRALALSALSVMDDFSAGEQLRGLLGVPSVETRYGAFHALWKMSPDDPAVRGEQLGGQFDYHVLETSADCPMIHVTKNRRAQIVLFGKDQKFLTPLSVMAGNRIMINGSEPDEIVVARFAPNEADQKRTVSARVDDVIRAIVELGGTYPDVVQALQEAKTAGALQGRFEVEALPEGGRAYDREEPAESDAAKEGNSST